MHQAKSIWSAVRPSADLSMERALTPLKPWRAFLEESAHAFLIVLAIEASRDHRGDLVEIAIDCVLQALANRRLRRGHRERCVGGHPRRVFADIGFEIVEIDEA